MQPTWRLGTDKEHGPEDHTIPLSCSVGRSCIAWAASRAALLPNGMAIMMARALSLAPQQPALQHRSRWLE